MPQLCHPGITGEKSKCMIFSVWNKHQWEDEGVWEKTRITAWGYIRMPKGKGKEKKMEIQEKLSFISFGSHRTAPLSFAVESI